ncbi:hypothetical protein CEXT_322311 [Caerostris extrusa]|uniref:Uncharacterized protein n=1 Tax=Caerostris extrusa TaxID=172846 RepID=A0AAV4Q648_CAEEX|nr:hypothetical protein CEXT_322311 [Caerostris extrusa]
MHSYNTPRHRNHIGGRCHLSEMSYLSDAMRFTVLVSVTLGKNGALDVWCLFVGKEFSFYSGWIYCLLLTSFYVTRRCILEFVAKGR